MPTSKELAKKYAQRIRDNVHKDGFYLNSKIKITWFRESHTYFEIQRINQEIDNLIYADNTTEEAIKLSFEDKNRIYRLLSEELNTLAMQDGADFRESASNDNLTELLEIVNNLLKGTNK